LIEILSPLVLLPGGCLYFQSIPKLSKSALSNRLLSFPPYDIKHPDTLLLTYLSIPICCHSFQTRQCEYCYPLNGFFIPSLYCYSLGIPETPFLMHHSFLAHDRNSSKSASVSIATRLTNFSSPACIATWWEFLREYCLHNTPSHSCLLSDHLIDNVVPMLLLTQTGSPPTNCRIFISELYMCNAHIFFGFCFPTCWLDRLSVIANTLRFQSATEILSPLVLLPWGSLCFNPCRTIQTNRFQLVFNFPVVWPIRKFQVDIATNLYSDMCDQYVPNPPVWVLLPS